MYDRLNKLSIRKSKDYVYGICVYKYLVYEKIIME